MKQQNYDFNNLRGLSSLKQNLPVLPGQKSSPNSNPIIYTFEANRKQYSPKTRERIDFSIDNLQSYLSGRNVKKDSSADNIRSERSKPRMLITNIYHSSSTQDLLQKRGLAGESLTSEKKGTSNMNEFQYPAISDKKEYIRNLAELGNPVGNLNSNKQNPYENSDHASNRVPVSIDIIDAKFNFNQGHPSRKVYSPSQRQDQEKFKFAKQKEENSKQITPTNIRASTVSKEAILQRMNIQTREQQKNEAESFDARGIKKNQASKKDAETPTKVNNFIEDPKPSEEILYRPPSGGKKNVLIYTNLKDITQGIGMKAENMNTPSNVMKPFIPQKNSVRESSNIGPTYKNNNGLKNFVSQVSQSINVPSLDSGEFTKPVRTPNQSSNSVQKIKLFNSNTKKKNGPVVPSVRSNVIISKSFEKSKDDPLNRFAPSFIYYMSKLKFYSINTFNSRSYFAQIYREHFYQSYQTLNLYANLKFTNFDTIMKNKVYLSKRQSHKDKKTIIFDLDETLIHCNENPSLPSDAIIPIKVPSGDLIEAGINIRPYARECLAELSSDFEIIIFTASHECYASAVLDYLDPEGKHIHHRLYRNHCVGTEQGLHIKDLRVLGDRSLENMAIVDNASYSFGNQMANGIPIIPFYRNKNDEELKDLVIYLKSLLRRDIRETNKENFKLHIYDKYNSAEDLYEYLFR